MWLTDGKHRNSARVIGALICPYHNIEVKSDVDWAQENNYIHKNLSISCARIKCEEQHGAVKSVRLTQLKKQAQHMTSFDNYSFYQPRIPTKTKKAVYKRSRNFSKTKIDTRSFRTIFFHRNGIQDKKRRQAIKMFRHVDGVNLGRFHTALSRMAA